MTDTSDRQPDMSERAGGMGERDFSPQDMRPVPGGLPSGNKGSFVLAGQRCPGETKAGPHRASLRREPCGQTRVTRDLRRVARPLVSCGRVGLTRQRRLRRPAGLGGPQGILGTLNDLNSGNSESRFYHCHHHATPPAMHRTPCANASLRLTLFPLGRRKRD